MFIPFDEDEYETVVHSRACTSCDGDTRKCNGACNGASGYSLVRRSSSEISKIKAERKLKYENDILEKASAILASRN